LPEYREELAAASLGHDEQAIRAATMAKFAGMQSIAESAFNRFLDLVGVPNRRVALPSRGM
jgi:GMP synthase (glutamine-hydrolysing)